MGIINFLALGKEDPLVEKSIKTLEEVHDGIPDDVATMVGKNLEDFECDLVEGLLLLTRQLLSQDKRDSILVSQAMGEFLVGDKKMVPVCLIYISSRYAEDYNIQDTLVKIGQIMLKALRS